MKLFICGYARHGKDTLAEILRDEWGLKFSSSSHFSMKRFLRQRLTLFGLTYETDAACYADRVNHRDLWARVIADYNWQDPCRLAREIFAENDVYVGIRDKVQLGAARELAQLAIWVQRDGWPEEAMSSCSIRSRDCDIVIENDGSIEDLRQKANSLFRLIDLTR